MFSRKKYDLPKFELSRAAGIVERPRLFELLDGKKDKRIIWLSAPAGAGKTSLIASYLSASNKNLIWYQVDAGDNDVASFFYYMGLCIKKSCPDQKGNLPTFTSEYLAGLKAFSVNYFRELFYKINQESVIVLDNYEEAGESALIHKALESAINEIPGNVQLVIISRQDPPSELARLHADSKFSLINFSDTKFTRDECDEVAIERSNNSLDENQLQKLFELTQGWAAGLILTLENLKSAPDFLNHLNFKNQNALFDYLANEIFSKFNEQTREALMKTAFLKTITIQSAKTLTNFPNIKNILTGLSSHQLLTVQHQKSIDNFEYHPLFREFLIQRAKLNYSDSELIKLQEKTGDLLLLSGEIQASAEQFIKIKNWSKLTRLILGHSETLLEQGLSITVEKWFDIIPEEIISQEPWLQYWQGCAILQIRPTEAKTVFINSYNIFLENSDSKGAYLSWTRIVESIVFAWDSFEDIPYWIKQLDALQVKYSYIPGIKTKIRVTLFAFSSLVHASPENSDFDVWLKRAERIFHYFPDDSVRIIAGAQLAYYYMFNGETDKQARVMKIMKRLEKGGKLLNFHQVYEKMATLFLYLITGEVEGFLANQRLCIEITKNNGIKYFDFLIEAVLVYHYLLTSNIEKAEQRLECLESLLDSTRRLNYALYLALKSQLYIQKGNYEQALTICNESVDLFTEVNGAFPKKITEIFLIQIYIYNGDLKNAEKLLGGLSKFTRETQSPAFEYIEKCLLGWIFILRKEFDSADNVIKQALFIGNTQNYFSSLSWSRDLFETVYKYAFKKNIQIKYVLEFIKSNNLLSKQDKLAIDCWPWPVRIHTLGRFGISVEDQPIDVNQKGMNKPAEMLKVLLSFGGRVVAEEKISDALWPDAEGDTAKQNFKTTLHRLRKLLLLPDILLLKNRKLSLNEHHCWVDSWALFSAIADSAQTKDIPEKTKHLGNLISSYQDDFLVNDSQFWVLNMRKKLRTQYLKTLYSISSFLVETGEIDAAVLGFEKHIEVEPLSEAGYQGLMGCYHQQGRQADVANIYIQCTEILQRELGARPSPATELLYSGKNPAE